MTSGKRVAGSGAAAEAHGSTSGADFSHDLAILLQELENFLDPEVIPDWLLTQQYTLGGRTPIEPLRDGHVAEVLLVANATEHGAYI